MGPALGPRGVLDDSDRGRGREPRLDQAARHLRRDGAAHIDGDGGAGEREAGPAGERLAVGIVAAVVRGNDTLLMKAYGRANVEWDVPMTVDAMFEVVEAFTPDGKLVFAFGTPGEAPGQFRLPSGILALDDGSLLVADSYNGRVQIFRVLSSSAMGGGE